MEKEQHELRSYGFFGIFKESFKMVFSWRKIFTQISSAFILPLCFVFFVHYHISEALFSKIGYRGFDESDQLGFPNYSELRHFFVQKWLPYWLFKVAYVFVLLILSLLSTAAVVYTIACIYTSKSVTFKKVMSVVPKVWKRLLVTFLWSYLLVFVFIIVTGAMFVLWGSIFADHVGAIAIVILVTLLILYLAGLVYITIVWHLGSVISVLEEVYGIKALKKSRNLLKGKTGVAVALFIVLGAFFGGIQTLYEILVLQVWPMSMLIKFCVGLACLLLMVMVVLVGLVVETVLYLVCKSYHHETIDKPTLSEQLEGYNWGYVPLKNNINIQMQHA
ncbi:hypothetical protein K2173_012092 [Erythroxylum novogranatense]|uniref:Uncharacterized protein n=1 Tax=Erythroxylum novogranatense TaxID=1862640 RepID=A0AAV8TGK2_9ROSI|nr:hypothetical protein K2173_012092 [Erythroxylum novogranatense]